MSVPRHHPMALGISVYLLGLMAAIAMGQAPPGEVRDGRLRSELALGGRTAVLAYAPELKASDPAHKALLSASETSGSARVRLGQLDTTGGLRIGAIELRGPDAVGRGTQNAAAPGQEATQQGPSTVRYDLWLESANNGWQLVVTDAAQAVVGNLPLSREAATPAAPTLIAALVPEEITVGHLVLRWGNYRAITDVQFTNPSGRRPNENPTPNEPVNRRHDADTSVLSRARLLAQRNETALVLPTGSRLSISFQRTFPRSERAGGNRTSPGLSIDRPDFARLSTTSAGEIVLLTESPVPRFRTEVPLRFGSVRIPIGNQVAGFPGSYGIWLKRAATGWRLVLNDEPDVWGSQHHSTFDAAEIEVAHSDGHAAARPFAVALVPTAADRGRLMIIWGPHEWTADFTVGG